MPTRVNKDGEQRIESLGHARRAWVSSCNPKAAPPWKETGVLGMGSGQRLKWVYGWHGHVTVIISGNFSIFNPGGLKFRTRRERQPLYETC